MLPESGLPAGIELWLALAAVPLVLAACTAFTKVSVVMAALRLGLGAESLLPFSAMFAVSAVVTAVIMAPVGLEMFEAYELTAAGFGPAAGADPGYSRWFEVARPLSGFLARHADESELIFFADLQNLGTGHPLVLVPGFLVTELAEALQMAVLILLPFALIDVLAAQVLALLGTPGQPLVLVTLPLKILLFLAAGGWNLVLGGLVEGYGLT